MKITITFNLVFANNTMWLWFFVFLYSSIIFLIHAVVQQIFNPTAELGIPTRTTTNEANVELGTEPLTAEMKIRKRSK